MKTTRVGFDIAKQVLQVHGVDEHGVAKVRKTLTRGKVLEFFAQLPRGLSRLAGEFTVVAAASVQPP